MKKITVLILLVIVPMLVRAQGTLYLSNLGQPSTSSTAIGSDFWIAQTFGPQYFGSTSYELNSVQLMISSTSGDSSGLAVSIYAGASSRSPKLFLGDLNFGSSTDGVYTYTASDIILMPQTYYFIAVTAAAAGDYYWSVANTTDHDGEWPLDTFYWDSNNGFDWSGPLYNADGNGAFQFAIYATPVPEPAANGLLGLSLAGFGLWRLRQTK